MRASALDLTEKPHRSVLSQQVAGQARSEGAGALHTRPAHRPQLAIGLSAVDNSTATATQCCTALPASSN